jgi:Fe-S cluster assembly protein SufD
MKKINMSGNVEWYRNAFAEFEKYLNGQSDSDLHMIRRSAIQNFTKLGYPTTKNEEWKYTDISSLAALNFDPTQNKESKPIEKQEFDKFRFGNLDCYVMTFVNGYFVAKLSSTTLPQNIVMQPISSALLHHSDIIAKYLTNYARFDLDSFSALNTAFLQEGAFVHVRKGAVLKKPIHIIFLSKESQNQILTQPRNLIIAEENSQVKIIQTHASLDSGTYFANAVDEVILNNNAVVEHFKLQLESENAYHISTSQVYQERSSNYVSHYFSAGGHLVRNNINSVLDAEGAECTLNGLYIANHNQHVDNHTVIDHAKPHCNSHELYKGILDDKASGVFNGKIYVRTDAQKTNAIQANNCLLLSDNASIDTKPQLEIYADDVKCTHGATIGQLDEDAYFYMRSRGIDTIKARNLLIFAFAGEVIDRIDIAPIREKIADLFVAKLRTIKPVLPVTL